MSIKKRFILICHDRSGSNLLKAILGQHPEVYVIPPLPIFEIIYYYRELYGDLQVAEQWDALLRDIAELYAANHHPLPYPVELEELRKHASAADRNLGGAVGAVFDLLGKQLGRPVLGLKFGAHQAIVEAFLDQTDFESAIFQYRDPRDVALSARKAGVDTRTPQEFAEHWLDWHRSVRRALTERSIPVLEHQYERLLADPLGTLRDVWNFLDLPPCEDALGFYRAESQQQAATASYMWQNVAKPLKRDNTEKFYAEWGRRQTRVIERAIGREGLAEFGYAPANLLKFSISAMLGNRWPQRRVRTEADRAFQERQSQLAERIKERWTEMKRSGDL